MSNPKTKISIDPPDSIDNDNEPMQVVFACEQKTPTASIFARFNSRLPLLAIAILGLLAAMWGGLIRVGWQFPPLGGILPSIHGPLMLVGFLGTLISLERAVAVRTRWAYLAPISCAIGSLVLFLDIDRHSGILIATLGSITLLLIFAVIVNRHLTLYTGTMMLAVVVWVLGNLLWLADYPIYRVVNWWAGFVILTIAGERLELSRIQRLSRNILGLYGSAVGIFLLGLIINLFETGNSATSLGARITGLGMLALALWLARYDIARRTVKQSGLPRFIAVCLLTGYGWLGASGTLCLLYGGATGGYLYDAILHTVFLGCGISMIFGHAPIIFPAVLGRPLHYYPRFYIHLGLLHFSLVLRITGDLLLTMPLRQWGALLNGIAILVFLFTTLLSIVHGARPVSKAKKEKSPRPHSERI